LPAGARLTGNERLAERYLTQGNWQTAERLRDFAEARGHSLLELALSWLARRPQVASVIAGATLPEQVEDNVRAVEWALSAEEMAEIDRLTI
jgi:aryl-alcohol dehydrogenase-like predicted oxidoreductase